MSELAAKLQQKIKTYKKQIEEAEEIAALNLAKYRKVKHFAGQGSRAQITSKPHSEMGLLAAYVRLTNRFWDSFLSYS